jgi:hypothetical protein
MLSEKLSAKEKARWFERGMRFAVEAKYIFDMVSYKDGQGTWAIYKYDTFFTENRMVLNSECEWEEDLDVDKRDANFGFRTRFTFDTALDVLDMYKSIYPD